MPGLDGPVAVMGALASRFHEDKAARYFDGTLSGFWNFALEPMLDQLEAWDQKGSIWLARFWDGGLVQLHECVADTGRLHIRSKTAAWLAWPRPQPVHALADAEAAPGEIDSPYRLLKAANMPVTDLKETRLAT